MMPRPRKPEYKDLPRHLRWNGRAYVYTKPGGKVVSVGTDKRRAIRAAEQLNALLYPADGDLMAKVLAGGSFTVGQMVDRYKAEHLTQQGYADKTLQDYTQMLVHIQREWFSVPSFKLTTPQVSEFINSKPPRMARRYKSLLSKFCRWCVSKGAMSADLTRDVLIDSAYKVKRQRLTLDQYKAIREQAEPWFAAAMDLALHSLQRQEDIAALRFSDVQDGHLSVIQRKTGAAVRIAIAGPLDAAIRACRDDLLSPFIVHKKPVRIGKRRQAMEHHTQVTPDQLSRAFKAARDATGLFNGWEAGTAPTFHEIRALGAQLYEEAGIDPQALLGHRDAATTKIYLDKRRIEWIEAIGGIPGL